MPDWPPNETTILEITDSVLSLWLRSVIDGGFGELQLVFVCSNSTTRRAGLEHPELLIGFYFSIRLLVTRPR